MIFFKFDKIKPYIRSKHVGEKRDKTIITIYVKIAAIIKCLRMFELCKLIMFLIIFINPKLCRRIR